MAGDSNNPFRRKGPAFSTPPAISVPDFPGGGNAGVSSASPAPNRHRTNPLQNDYDYGISSAASVPTPVSGSELFRQQLQSLPKSAEAPPSTTFQKPKPVKKVRVQSPPPSSPESAHNADFEARFLPATDGPTGFLNSRRGGGDTSSDDSEDAAGDDFVRAGSSAPSRYRPGDANDAAGQMSSASARFPPNPFQRTLGDLEQPHKEATPSGAGATAATALPSAKPPLNVDAFRRLLMTGQSGASSGAHNQQATPQLHPSPYPPSSSHHQTDAASVTDASSVSRQSIFDERPSNNNLLGETPRTSHEISEPEGDEDQHGLISSHQSPQQQRTTLRKKPPPPVSRHGKLIKVELGNDGAEGGAQPKPGESALPSSPGSSTDLNKPLPPAPRVSVDDPRESVFDREAAGKIPEVDVDPDAPDGEIPPPRPPTPPNASHSTTSAAMLPQSRQPLASRPPTTASRKPAPPPRRQTHGRTDSRATITSNASLTSPSMAPPPLFSPSSAGRGEDQVQVGEQVRRVSSESVRSRSSSIRAPGVAPPAPPPPRRPANTNATPRQSSAPGALTSPATPAASPSATDGGGHDGERWASRPMTPGSGGTESPSAAVAAAGSSGISVNSQSSPSPGGSSHPLRPAVMPPPPPPARHRSVRSAANRPASVKSLDAASRRIEPKEGMPAPPPPPPRPRGRGSSRLAAAENAHSSYAGGDSVDAVAAPVAREGDAGPSSPAAVGGDPGGGGGAENILADLDALQREVDALRGQMSSAG